MAGCYHDTQDFKSDLNIEVAREGDILREGYDLDEIECNKNHGHRGFIPFKGLTLDHLPNEIRNREILDNIKKRGNLVVKLVINKKKRRRKRVRESGSGCVVKLNSKYVIQTNNHVVKTDEEVKNCTVEFHYDDGSRSDVLTSRGVELTWTCPYRDVTYFMFHPIPDFVYQLLDDILPDIVIMYTDNQIETPSKVLIATNSSKCPGYTFHDLNSSVINLMFLAWQDGSISYFKNSYFKFQPIPSNIHVLPSIQIHIDKDDGNSRVIPGNLVKCGDEIVVEISETIFQDEVRKCRIVSNGNVIGYGTRLYFGQFKSSNMFSGVDLEHRIDNDFWMFDCHPIPRGLEGPFTEPPKNMCCIGHPHGGLKMVTFGRLLEESVERFDNQYRRIAQPGTDCTCKEVGVRKYSCKTCPGSSGSPIFYLFQGMEWGGNFTHFMGEKVKRVLPNGELIENINTAWSSAPPKQK